MRIPREGSHLKTKAEIGGGRLQQRNDKTRWPPPEAGEEARKDPPIEFWRASGLADTLISEAGLQNWENTVLLL